MRLPTAVLIGLLVAVAGGFLAFQFLPPIPLTRFEEIADETLLGRYGSALLMGIAVYATAVSALIGGGIVRELTNIRRRLASLNSELDGPITREGWESAFSGTMLEPLREQIVAMGFATGGDRLVLAAPFSPPLARAEMYRFFLQHLALAQVWTIAVLLPGMIAAAALAAVPPNTGIFLTRAVAISETLLLATVGFALLGAGTAIDRLISTVARLSFTLATRSRPSAIAPEENSASRERLSTSVAAEIQIETQASLARLETLVAQNLGTEQRLLERLNESLARAVFEGIEKVLSASRQKAEDKVAELDRVRVEMTHAFETVPTILAEQFSAHYEKIIEQVGTAISAERAALHKELSGVKRTISHAAERQIDELHRLAAEDRIAMQQLGDGIRQVFIESEREAHGGFAKAIESMQSIEAYAASLLPAIRRLEGSEERVATAIAFESETLSRLSVFVKELSGTLEAVQIALAHGRAKTAPLLVEHQPEEVSTRLAQGTRQEANIPDITAQLRSLLDELEEKPF